MLDKVKYGGSIYYFLQQWQCSEQMIVVKQTKICPKVSTKTLKQKIEVASKLELKNVKTILSLSIWEIKW